MAVNCKFKECCDLVPARHCSPPALAQEASIFRDKCSAVQKELIEPALNGTKNVLGSVAKTKGTIKRVVLTSSFAGKLALQKLGHVLPCSTNFNIVDHPALHPFQHCCCCGLLNIFTFEVSCNAAIVRTKSGPSSPPLYTEKDWNNESTIEDGEN